MSKMAKATLCLMIVTMISKILGFLRELILTYTYGASAISDAYITSVSIPTILFALIASALGTTFIPLFYQIDKEDGRQNSLLFANNVFNIIIILTLLLAMAGFIFAEPLVKLFAMDFTGEKLEIAVRFTRIMIFGVVFIGLSNIMSSWLQINDKFAITGIVGIPYNIIIIIGILLSSKININLIAICTTIAMASKFFILLPYSIKSGYKYTLHLNLKDKNIKKMLYLIIPVFIGAGVNQLNTIIDRSLASTLGDGIITVLNSANRLNSFVLGLFIATIGSVIYPKLSRLADFNNREKFSETVSNCINSIILLIIPISVGAIVLSEPIVKIVFERGEFTADASRMTAIALACYSIGMIGFGLRDILGKVFYSIQDTKTPMLNGAIAMCLNILLNIIFIKTLGYIGLALATSISSIVCIISLFINLRNKIGYFGQDKIVNTSIKVFGSSILMGIITHITHKLMNILLGIGFINEVIILIISISIGAISYILTISKLKVEEIYIILNIARKKLKA